ncbi:MAG: flagellar biosynthetic protein FliQ [Polyangiaceae bacterium]
MTTDGAATLITRFTETALYVATPILVVAAIVGVFVGIVQTATQINEPAIAYAAKVVGLVALLLLAGPLLTDKLLTYTRQSFAAIAEVVE